MSTAGRPCRSWCRSSSSCSWSSSCSDTRCSTRCPRRTPRRWTACRTGSPAPATHPSLGRARSASASITTTLAAGASSLRPATAGPRVIKGLLLDLYGTLVEDDDAIMRAIAAEVAAGASPPVSSREGADLWDREYQAEADRQPFRPLRDCALTSLATVMAALGCAADPAPLHERHFQPARSPALRPGTREFLDHVTLPICVVSDADRDDLDAAMALHGLTFAAVVSSEDVGRYKPDKAMFAHALDALGLAADEVLHVGDSITTDVHGAHAAGIRAVWVNRRGEKTPANAPIAHEIADLRELLPIID